MQTDEMMAALNKAMALEQTASLQYQQHALLVRGLWRKFFADFFATESRQALKHAHKFGQTIVAGGGVPTGEVGARVRPSLDLAERVQHDLELERDALQAYREAWTLAAEDVALRTMLEDHMETAQRDIDELAMYLSMVHTGAMASAGHWQVGG